MGRVIRLLVDVEAIARDIHLTEIATWAKDTRFLASTFEEEQNGRLEEYEERAG